MIVPLWQGTIQNTFQNIHHSSRLRNIRCSNLLANVKCIRRPEEAEDGGGSEPGFPLHPAELGCGASWSPCSVPSAFLFFWVSMCPTKISQTQAAASLSLLLRRADFHCGLGKEKVVLKCSDPFASCSNCQGPLSPTQGVCS